MWHRWRKRLRGIGPVAGREGNGRAAPHAGHGEIFSARYSAEFKPRRSIAVPPVIAHPTPGRVESLGEAGIFAYRDARNAWSHALSSLSEPNNWARASPVAPRHAPPS